MLAAMIEKKPMGHAEMAKLGILKDLLKKVHGMIAQKHAEAGGAPEGSPEEEHSEPVAEAKMEMTHPGMEAAEQDEGSAGVHSALKDYMRPKKKELPKFALMGGGSSMAPKGFKKGK